MRTTSVVDFERVVSPLRLNSYKSYFKATTMDEAIGLYLWNGEISGCFASHLAHFEVALRNSVHRAMSLFHSAGRTPSCHWYDVIRESMRHSVQQRIVEVRTRRPRSNPGPDEIVSNLSFGFWPVMLNSVSAAHASRVLPRIFPNHPFSDRPAQWSDARKRRETLGFLAEIQGFRNRLAHHEPLWKFGAVRVVSGSHSVISLPASRTQTDSLHRLRRMMLLIEDATGFVDRSLHEDLKAASWRQRLDFLLTERGVERYRLRKHVAAPVALTPTEFRCRFKALHRRNQPVRVRRAHTSGLFVPD
ncbi:Abi family protein [Cupriavidus sp. SW-Y-13]|uniref:Abi family protein n=1 Tax=Cupriavidus sp. SW-Y-13 TaxID=2653854 RepID=UPI00139BE181|nr:Abi family protein [Cupriavidus sp. SW-Y-13]MWL86044.1 hypothetical protein [Cupriavidus sp. SW-Y-13]